MILLKTTTEIDQKLLDEGRVRIAVDLGFAPTYRGERSS